MQVEAGKKNSKTIIGVLDYQGGVEEHYMLLSRLKGVNPKLIQYPSQLAEIDGLIIPGGESTTLLKLMAKDGMDKAIVDFSKKGKPLWGTCAGLIVLGSNVTDFKEKPLGLIDIEVERNAYGSQLDSFIVKEKLTFLSNRAVELVFIRAPKIIRIGKGVESLYIVNGATVFAKNSTIMVTSFHPELTRSTLFHKYFADMVIASLNG